MTRRRVTFAAVIALGSNLGDREATLREAVQRVDDLNGVTVTAVSGVVESHAVKFPDRPSSDPASPNYLNAVMVVDSALDPESLLVQLNLIEAELGRVRAERWGDRTLDLDIITCAGLRMSSQTLTLPHPLAWQRSFVIVPWLQVQPDAELPGLGPIALLDAATSSDVWDFSSASLFATLDE